MASGGGWKVSASGARGTKGSYHGFIQQVSLGEGGLRSSVAMYNNNKKKARRGICPRVKRARDLGAGEPTRRHQLHTTTLSPRALVLVHDPLRAELVRGTRE